MVDACGIRRIYKFLYQRHCLEHRDPNGSRDEILFRDAGLVDAERGFLDVLFRYLDSAVRNNDRGRN